MPDEQEFDREFFRNLCQLHREMLIALSRTQTPVAETLSRDAQNVAKGFHVPEFTAEYLSPVKRTIVDAYHEIGFSTLCLEHWVKFMFITDMLAMRAGLCNLDPPARIELMNPKLEQEGRWNIGTRVLVASPPPFDVVASAEWFSWTTFAAGPGTASSVLAGPPDLDWLERARVTVREGLESWLPVLEERMNQLAGMTGWPLPARKPVQNDEPQDMLSRKRAMLSALLSREAESLQNPMADIEDALAQKKQYRASETTLVACEVHQLAERLRYARDTVPDYGGFGEEIVATAKKVETAKLNAREPLAVRLRSAASKLRELVRGWPTWTDEVLARLLDPTPNDVKVDEALCNTLYHVFHVAEAIDVVRRHARDLEGSLTDREEDVIIAMTELGATSADRRRPSREIVRKAAGAGVSPDSFKDVFKSLKSRDFIDSLVQGRTGGYWLTPVGASYRPGKNGSE